MSSHNEWASSLDPNISKRQNEVMAKGISIEGHTHSINLRRNDYRWRMLDQGRWLISQVLNVSTLSEVRVCRRKTFILLWNTTPKIIVWQPLMTKVQILQNPYKKVSTQLSCIQQDLNQEKPVCQTANKWKSTFNLSKSWARIIICEKQVSIICEN